MTKIIIFIVLICAVHSAVRREFRQNRKFHLSYQRHNPLQLSPSVLCENITVAQTLVNKIRELITTLEGNSSYTDVLQKHTNTINYIKNDNNFNLLSTNCTEYCNGLNNARKLDKTTGNQPDKSENNLNRLLKQIIQSVLGPNAFMHEDFF